MLATIEQNHLAVDDSVNLSAAWLERHYLREQTIARYLRGDIQRVTTRGIAPMVVTLLMRYGAMPYDAYRPRNGCDMQVLARRLARLADVCRTRRTGLEYLTARIDDTLDRYMGPAPRYAFMFGTEYTPTQFAHSLLLPRDYIALTSFTHHPFYQSFDLELPDNTRGNKFLNLPLDTLMARLDTAINRRQAVCWEGDVSEPLFSFKKGTAYLADRQPPTQENRQRQFEQFQTTDDHCMAIVGRATDEQGRRYYIMKNSWGTANPYGGLMYISENYVRMKTIALFARR